MAVITHARRDAPHPLHALATTLGRRAAALARRAAAPHRAALANLAHIPLTLAGAAAVDYAAFHLASGWGWLTTGASLILLEHLIADEP